MGGFNKRRGDSHTGSDIVHLAVSVSHCTVWGYENSPSSDKYAESDDFADITVPPGGSFADMVALKGTTEISDGINKVIARLADADQLLG